MSQTPENTQPARLSLRKRPPSGAASGSTAGDQPKRLPTPRTIDYACIALGVTGLAMVLRAVLLQGSTGQLQKFLIHANDTAGSKKKPNYVADHLSDDLHALRQGALLMGVVIALALVLLIFALRRTRTASGSRWAMLIVMLFTELPFYVIPVSGFPAAAKVAGVVVGIASILAILLIFIPKPSQQYFRACKEAATPPELRGQPRPSLFGPRRQRPGMAGPGGRAAAAQSPPDRAQSAAPENRGTGQSKARAKVRADADAVARGAELARSRAKASKSRRTPD